MEKIRARLNIGSKAEPVKLRKRKSQLYSKEETCPLDNGTVCALFGIAAIIFLAAD